MDQRYREELKWLNRTLSHFQRTKRRGGRGWQSDEVAFHYDPSFWVQGRWKNWCKCSKRWPCYSTTSARTEFGYQGSIDDNLEDPITNFVHCEGRKCRNRRKRRNLRISRRKCWIYAWESRGRGCLHCWLWLSFSFSRLNCYWMRALHLQPAKIQN